MAITSIDSYRDTTLAFFDNWETANAEMAPGALILGGNYNRAAFGTDRTTMLTSMDSVLHLAQTFRTKAAARDTLKLNLTQRAIQLRLSIQAQILDAQIRKRAQTAPHVNSDIAKFTKPLKANAEIWEEINSDLAKFQLTAPLTLQGGYTLAEFQADIVASETLTDQTATAERTLNTARGTLRNQLKAIYERMKQYRAAVMAQLPKNSPARQTLPRLTPKPGTKPPAVAVSGAWDAVISQARLTWLATDAKDLLKLQVRACVGPHYKPSEETIVADLPGDAIQWQGDWGLTVPGNVASFKVYVMTTTDNENGGKAVKIVRPLPQD